MRRTLLTAVVLAVVGAFAGPALATNTPPVPVGVGRDSEGGVCVYGFSWVPQCVDPIIISAAPKAQPPAPPVGVWRTADGRVCAAFGSSMPVCTPGVSPVIPGAMVKQKLPYVTVVNNSYAVGVLINNADGSPFAGAVIAKDGSQACIGLSYQAPICLS